jgi:hypothetical protein
MHPMYQQPPKGGFHIDQDMPKTKRPLSKINKTKIFERSAERQTSGLWSVLDALFAFGDV